MLAAAAAHHQQRGQSRESPWLFILKLKSLQDAKTIFDEAQVQTLDSFHLFSLHAACQVYINALQMPSDLEAARESEFLC